MVTNFRENETSTRFCDFETSDGSTTAIDPSGMPKGDYIVMFYKTVFSHKTAYELVTLYLEDGQWTCFNLSSRHEQISLHGILCLFHFFMNVALLLIALCSLA